MLKKFLRILAIVLLIVVAALLVRTLTLQSNQIAAPAAAAVVLDERGAIARFSRAIQFQTVSYSENAKPVEHEAFIAWLAEAYPRVHASLRRELVNGRSLLYTWPGSDASLPAVLLMGHYDVVPIEPGTESKWERPPFSGAIANGFVYGRGTLDDKFTVVALLEAAELLLAEGHRPRRTILFAFGHDEEIGGHEGAAQIAKLLAARGVKLDSVIDEGGTITSGILAGAPKPVAVIGIAEKGFTNIELRAHGLGGHSSMPPPRTEVGAIAEAVARVQNEPFPAEVRGATAEMFRWLAPEMPFAERVVLSNLWLFEPLLRRQGAKSPSLNATLRTTTAPTIIGGGVKDNVIPSDARAVINFRILPGDSVKRVADHVRKSIGDEHIQLRVIEGTEPSPVSDPSAPSFVRLQKTIAQHFPNVIAAPYLVVGATDARWYRTLTPNVYRFVPYTLTERDLARAHGSNERVPVTDYLQGIRFYRTLILNSGATLTP
jgi:carboxypeptidase PM20D1